MPRAVVMRDADAAVVTDARNSVAVSESSEPVSARGCGDDVAATSSIGNVRVTGASDSATARGGASAGATNYNLLDNKPSIEGVELIGDRMLSEFGLAGGDNVDVDHGHITVEELTAAQVAALLTDD